MIDRLLYLTCIGFGLGKIKPAPGTWGSLPGLGLGLGLQFVLQAYGLTLALGALVFLALLAFLAIRSVEKKKTGHDAPEIVIDEILGQSLAVFLFTPSLLIYGLGFILFRILDIRKPGPIGWIDKKVPGALGTLLDDLVAGLFTAGILGLSISLLLKDLLKY